MAQVSLETRHPGPGRAEQDPASWWSAVLEGCDELRGRIAGGFGSVVAVGLTGARQTFALFGSDRRALLPAILWSDRRAGAAAGRLARERGIDPADAAAPADRSTRAWWPRSSPGWPPTTRRSSQRPRGFLTPRDLVGWQLSGEVVTDTTMVSRAGLHDRGGLLGRRAGGGGWRVAPHRRRRVDRRRRDRGDRRRAARAPRSHTGRHRSGRPGLRGARCRCDRRPSVGELGNDRQRVVAGRRRTAAGAAEGHRRVAGRRGGLAARGRSVRCWLLSSWLGRLTARLLRPSWPTSQLSVPRVPVVRWRPRGSTARGRRGGSRMRRPVWPASARPTGSRIWPAWCSSRWGGRCAAASTRSRGDDHRGRR